MILEYIFFSKAADTKILYKPVYTGEGETRTLPLALHCTCLLAEPLRPTALSRPEIWANLINYIQMISQLLP